MTVTRVVIVGLATTHEHFADSWAVSVQDDGRTLKLFAEGHGTAARIERDEQLRRELEAGKP